MGTSPAFVNHTNTSQWINPKNAFLCFHILGDKDDDDDDDADEKMQPSNMTGGEGGRQESQEQSEVDHGDFEMVVSFATTMSPAVGHLKC